jgi:hypothetical protein
MSRFRSSQARELMAFTLALDPTMSDMLRRMFRMGAHDIRPDHMYVFNPATGKHDYMADPGAWNARINEHVGVSLLRGRDGVWFLNGF